MWYLSSFWPSVKELAGSLVLVLQDRKAGQGKKAGETPAPRETRVQFPDGEKCTFCLLWFTVISRNLI